MAKKTKNNLKVLEAVIAGILFITVGIITQKENFQIPQSEKVQTAKASETSEISEKTKNNEDSKNNQNSDVQETEKNNDKSEELQIDYLDVGQADSILVKSNSQVMLIDAGNNDDGNFVVKYLRDKGISKIDYLVGTHPHEDHIGGLDDVINNFDIGTIYMPAKATNTKTFEDVLDAIDKKGLAITEPHVGDKFNISSAQCEVMAIDSNAEELNQTSIVIRMEYGSKSFLFMGDAETPNEEKRSWPQTTVLKVGHHGSNTSSSKNFLQQVKPEISIIEVGKDNKYHLPTSKTLQKLNDIGTQIYRTDENGTIEIKTDGKQLNVIKEK